MSEVRDAAEPIRVLLADDHDGFRAGLEALLATAGGIGVVGTARDGTEAVDAVVRLQPDVVLMDLAMPGLGGVEATRRIATSSPHVAVLVLTMDEEQESVVDAIRAGARGYLLKGAGRAELVRAIRALAAGEAIFGPAIARRLDAMLSHPAPAGMPDAFPQLTEREREVLELIAQGRSNAEITSTLVVSPKTVRNHVSNIFAKLAVRDRAEAIVLAREAGLGGERERRG